MIYYVMIKHEGDAKIIDDPMVISYSKKKLLKPLWSVCDFSNGDNNCVEISGDTAMNGVI